MFKKISRALCGLMVSAIALSTAACGPQKIENNENGKTTINISIYGGGHGTAYLDTLIKNFMAKNPDYAEKYVIKYDEEKLHEGLIQDELEAGYGETQMYISAHNNFVNFIYSDWLEDLSDVVAMKPDGESGKTIRDKVVGYDQWQSIYSKYGEGVYALPYADSIMGFVYDHDLFVDSGWYTFADESDKDALTAQGIVFSEKNGKLYYESSENSVNYEQGDRILTAGKDGKYGTYDDGQPQNVAEWDAMISKISGSKSKAFISGGKVGSYAQHLISAYFAQYSGSEAYDTYFTYDSNGEKVKLSDGTETEITVDNGYLVYQMEGVYKAYEFFADYFDIRKKNDSKVAVHSVLPDTTKSHTDAQDRFLYGYLNTSDNPQSAMLIEGAWWEYEARDTFNEIGEIDASRGFGQREYRFMLLPDLEGQKNDKSVISACESGAFIVPKDSNKERLQVTKEFLAYMISDEAMNYFLTLTGSIMPYEYTLTEEETAALRPFTKNMIELYNDKENIEVVRPQIAALYSPLTYAGGKPANYFVTTGLNNSDSPFISLGINDLSAIKTGLGKLYTEKDWSKYVSEAKKQGFLND